jgi:hypothetical protein
LCPHHSSPLAVGTRWEKDTSHPMEIVIAPPRRPVVAQGSVAVAEAPGGVIMPAPFAGSGYPGQAEEGKDRRRVTIGQPGQAVQTDRSVAGLLGWYSTEVIGSSCLLTGWRRQRRGRFW